jgi:uncharacterized membrane protein SpoIIM required for sporulation
LKLPSFINKNKTKWENFERYVQNKSMIDAEKLSDLYIEILDDLSFAMTFYPKSDIIPYLHNLASRAHQNIYKSKKEGRNRIIEFFMAEFPLEFYSYRKYLLISFLFFALFTIIGWYSISQDDNFARLILGDSYVNMTLENIEKGDPMAVYKEMNSVNMFLGITINNVMVAIRTFVMGIIFIVGTIYSLVMNGVMLGTFLGFFAERDLIWESFRTIWIHGTIEISVILVAGAGGIVLGAGLIFPDTYTRLVSLRRAAKSGLKIMMSTIPFFIIAGFLEGFVTRHTEMPDAIAMTIIISSLFLVIFYYVVYPVMVFRKTKSIVKSQIE